LVAGASGAALAHVKPIVKPIAKPLAEPSPGAGLPVSAEDSFVRTQADGEPRGPVMQLPGLPPIQLPPGARVFGPDGEPGQPFRLPGASPRAQDGEGRNSDSEKAAAAPKTRDEMLADLFQRLAKAESREEARGIVGAIDRLWSRSGSDTANLLMSRAVSAMQKKNVELALRLFDKMVVIEPEWAELWHRRATARYLQDDPDGAVEDLANALAREPRHFGALVGLGLILHNSSQNALALKAFRRALEIHPHLEDIKTIYEKLELAVDGQPI